MKTTPLYFSQWVICISIAAMELLVGLIVSFIQVPMWKPKTADANKQGVCCSPESGFRTLTRALLSVLLSSFLGVSSTKPILKCSHGLGSGWEGPDGRDAVTPGARLHSDSGSPQPHRHLCSQVAYHVSPRHNPLLASALPMQLCPVFPPTFGTWMQQEMCSHVTVEG